MKKITTPFGKFGPFENITVSDDRYICDGFNFFFTVIGQGEILEASPDDFLMIRPGADEQWAAIRSERNSKLSACDWTQLPDAPVDKLAWAAYRQELRDITTQPDPFNIVWPIAPGA